ncbi:MAG: efflux RND transporter permease subunit, partial [Armatimonadota bacterium]
ATFSRRTGTELGFAITEPNRGDYAIMLKPNRKRSIDDVIADVRAKVKDQVGGLEVEFIQVLQDLIGDLAGNPNPIEVKLFGEDKEQVESVAKDLAEKLGKVKGLVDIKSGLIESGPELQFIPNPNAVARHGVTNDAISDQLNGSMLGIVATNIIQGDRQIPVRVRLPAILRTNMDQVGRLPIMTPTGKVPLKDLGELTLVAGTTQSSREDQLRVVNVTAGLENVDLGTAVKGVQGVLKETKFPSGVTAKLAGQYLSQTESFNNLLLVLGTSVLLVFTVMMFQFRSFQAPLVVLILMPLSLFGAVLALFVTKTAMNVSSFMGVIMLAGVVVKNGILLLDRAQSLIQEGAPPDVAVLGAVQARLRPILMTTLTAILGLLPLAFGLGAGAEMQKPLAVAVVGGLAFSTVLTLLIGPVLYASFMSLKKSKELVPD